VRLPLRREREALPPGHSTAIRRPMRLLAKMPTRLAKVEASRQKALFNWGYAISPTRPSGTGICETLRPRRLPYPGGVG
jgi:hypothetical protein